MNTELRSKNPSVFSDKTYSDEPILRTAAQMKNYEPPEYREMRKIEYYSYEKGWSSEHVFFEQAKFMENFEDDYAFNGGFSSYFPTYTAMSAEQLRGYFSWRTAVRKGELRSAPVSFAFLYLYELMNRIGTANPEEGFFRLYRFCEKYGELFPELSRYSDTWFKDYIAFYDLDASLFASYCDLRFEESLSVLQRCGSVGNKELFDALAQLCGYNIRESAFYKEYPREYAYSLCLAYRNYDEKYNKTHKNTFAEKLFGRICAMPYTVFGAAVFYDRSRTRDHTTTLCDNYSYAFTNGACICHRCWGKRGKSSILSDYVRYTDSLLRESFGFDKPLKATCPAKPFDKIVRDAIAKTREQVLAAEEAERRRFVDTSLLDDIMTSADHTRDKLLTEEEIGEELAPEPEQPVNVPEENTDTPDALPVTPEEAGFIRCLLAGSGAAEYARAHDRKISLLCDNINEKLYDIFYDTVIDFDGDVPRIIEDYAEELRKMTGG